MRVINKYLGLCLLSAPFAPLFGQMSTPNWKIKAGITAFMEQKGSKDLSIEDAFNPKNYPSGPFFTSYPSPKFVAYQYLRNKDKGNHIYRANPGMGELKNSEEILVHFDSVQSTMKSYGETVGFLSFNFDTEESGWFVAGDRVFNFFLRPGGRFEAIPMLKLSKDRVAEEISTTDQACMYQNGKTTCRMAAYVENHNIFVSDYEKTTQITFDGKEGIVYGQSVHRNEFGINKGMYWSPNAHKLAFYRMDERRVTKYPMFSINERPAKPTEIRYPMAGDSSHTVTVGIYDPYLGKSVYLKTDGEYDQYLTNITWSPDSKSIFIARVNRDQNMMHLLEYSSETGELIKTHFVESHPKYIEPENGPIFLGSSIKFIWQSELDGYNRLYLHENGKITKLNLPEGIYEITDVLGLSSDEKTLVCVGTYGTALNRALFSIDMVKNKSQLLKTNLGGTPVSVFNKFNPFVVITTSSITSNREIIAINWSQKFNAKTFETPALLFENKNPISDFNIGKIELSSIEHPTDNVTLFTRTFYPPNFDINKKYPVVVYVYGGPHAQMVTNSWLGGGNLWMAYMASKGYIVFTLDNRGSSHRGLDFENAVHRQLGTLEMSDQLAGLNWLKSQTFVDSSRIGVHGWSFGGFMTTSLMTREAGKYKVGVAGGPVIDWKYYEIMYTERYMDRPEENPTGYEANNLINHTGKLKGRLLQIHGADDDVVVWQHSMLFVKKSVELSNPNLDYFVYPGHKHNVSGRDRIHLYKKVSQYFFDHL
jgi:dipeptidyl-peptidase-4